jgi:hypothetical protein
MKPKCENHPNKESIAPCHSCGKYFCADCLNVGEEYYYCNQENCRQFLNSEKKRTNQFEEGKHDLIKQKWKENNRHFFKKKLPKILFIIWLIFTIFLWLINPSYNTKGYFWAPLISLAVTAKWLILILFVRFVFYKSYKCEKWEKELKKEALKTN